jgi:hypothetical protein
MPGWHKDMTLILARTHFFGAKYKHANNTNHQAVHHSKYNQFIIESYQPLVIKNIL